MFSSARVQRTLAQIVDESAEQHIHDSAWQLCTLADIPTIRNARFFRQGTWNDTSLALTFASAMQGRAESGASLRGRPLYPAIFLQECYDDHQDDATLFLRSCLANCPWTLHIFLLLCKGPKSGWNEEK